MFSERGLRIFDKHRKLVHKFEPYQSYLTNNESYIFFTKTNYSGIFFHDNAFYLDDNGNVTRLDSKYPYVNNISCSTKTSLRTNVLDVNPFVPGCYLNDNNNIRTFRLSLGITDGFVSKFGNVPATIAALSVMVTQARLIYKMQLNIVLQVDNMYFSFNDTSTDSILHTAMNKQNCNYDMGSTLSSFSSWSSSKPTSGAFHLFTDCFPPPGYVGLANVGTICANGWNVALTSHCGSYWTWLIFAHELGHNFGALHTFQNGVGTTGGIMDYGNPIWNGSIQFNPYNRAQMCSTLRSVVPTCKFFTLISSGNKTSTCGDGILEVDEECECLDSTNSCRGCNKCRLINKDRECSKRNFVMHNKAWQKSDDQIVISSEMLSHEECCSKGRFLFPDTVCAVTPFYNGLCMSGRCQSICERFQLLPCPAKNICVKPCRFRDWGPCSSDIKTSEGDIINFLPKGVKCAKGSYECNGNGDCVFS